MRRDGSAAAASPFAGRAFRALAAGSGAVLLAGPVAAADAGATAPAIAASAPAPTPAKRDEPGAAAGATCTEHLAAGKQRPRVTETFPSRGKSGYAAELELDVEHGKGETVLPGGFSVQFRAGEARALENAGFSLPEPEAGARAEIEREEIEGGARTHVRIPFVILPKKPGRQRLELPPLPLAVSRASGEVMTLCTEPHGIVVDDPIANDPSPVPKANPKPRRQQEVWTAAKQVTLAALGALVVGALLAWLILLWLRRPKKARPGPPPRPPWEVALEELFDVKNAGLIEQQRYTDHFDRVSHAIRKYLGGRYGFDGLECTTEEMIDELRLIEPPIVILDEIESFLRLADLVKFAKATPTEAECKSALERGEGIVHRTIPPLPEPGMRAAAPPDGTDPASPAEPGGDR